VDVAGTSSKGGSTIKKTQLHKTTTTESCIRDS